MSVSHIIPSKPSDRPTMYYTTGLLLTKPLIVLSSSLNDASMHRNPSNESGFEMIRVEKEKITRYGPLEEEAQRERGERKMRTKL